MSDPPAPTDPPVPPPAHGPQTPPPVPEATAVQAVAPAIPLDERGAIAVDLACRRCGYDLRGLREDGRCPECGTPIGLSTRGDLLRFADPDWLDKVARGLSIILWMMLAWVGVLVASIVFEFLKVRGMGLVLAFAASLVSFYGVWLMTEPDPSGIGEDPNVTARKVVRITLLVGLASQPIQFVRQEWSLDPGVHILLAVLAIIVILIALVGEFAKFIYYERLGARIPDEFIVRRARFLRWAFTIALGVSTVGGLLAAFVPTGGTAPAAGLAVGLGCLGVSAGIAVLVFGIMMLFLLLRLRRAIAEQARLAWLTWAAATQ